MQQNRGNDFKCCFLEVVFLMLILLLLFYQILKIHNTFIWDFVPTKGVIIHGWQLINQGDTYFMVTQQVDIWLNMLHVPQPIWYPLPNFIDNKAKKLVFRWNFFIQRDSVFIQCCNYVVFIRTCLELCGRLSCENMRLPTFCTLPIRVCLC